MEDNHNEQNDNDNDRMDIATSVASAHQDMNGTSSNNVEEMIDILSKDIEMIRFVEVSHQNQTIVRF